MYKIHIITKFNEIDLEVEELSPKVWEIIEQPYVIEVYIEKQKEITLFDDYEQEQNNNLQNKK